MSDERDLGAITVAELVAEALGADEDDGGRWGPIGELQRRGDEETLAAALGLLDSPDANGRVLGADILRQIAWEHPDSEPSASIRARGAARLFELLGREDDTTVLAAMIGALGNLNVATALEPVLALASDSNAQIRLAVAMAFPGLTGGDRPFDELEPRDSGRIIAMLAALGDDEDGDVREWALFALGRQYKLDSTDLRELFFRHLDDSHPGARGEAIVGLARRGDRRALPAVLNAIDPEMGSEELIEAAAYLAAEQLLAPLLGLVDAGWPDNSTLDEAIRNCDPAQRAHWAGVGDQLAAILSAEIREQTGDPSPRVRSGREPLEWWPIVVGAWTRADGSEAELSYDIHALAHIRLEDDLRRAAAVFREDIAKVERTG